MVNQTAQQCDRELGSALGVPFYRCVVDRLLERQTTAQADGTAYYPIVPHVYGDEPFGPARGYSGGDELKDILRDYMCDASGPGSAPVRTMTWSYSPAEPCDAAGHDDGSPFVYHAGYLPAGNEMAHLDGRMDEERAMAVCAADERCAGFTHQGERGGERLMQFKSDADGVTLAPGWHAFKKRARPLDCSSHAIDRRRRAPPVEYRIDVLRESPPVYVAHDFVSAAECDWMVNHTLPRMGPSVVVGGGVSPIRKSYSVNMVPDFDDETHVVTALARRKFAFAREVAGYDELVEGPGQEPINAVYYFNYGDEYRAHCDGECHGNPHRLGGRLATSLSYCIVPEAGGHTLFTRSALKVVPRPRQMLFFGYKRGDGMDNGHTEHSGCAFRRGRKWIATMWYRDGVSAERDWSTFKFT